MLRTDAKNDSRSDRGKEQVVRIEAVGVTILWVNCTIGRVDQLLHDLEVECVEGNGLGWLGSRYGVVTVLDVCVAKPTPESITDNSERSCTFFPTDRLPVEEIYANIKGGAELTGDFMWGLACAGIIAAVGLFTNSSVMLVASMLISPMMGPILAMTFAMAIKTKVTQTVKRKELRATRDLRDLTNLSEVFRPLLEKDDIVQLPETTCFLKGSNNGEMKRRLGKLIKLKDTPAECDSKESGQFTTWMVKTMVPEKEWETEWKDCWAAPDDTTELIAVPESELIKPEAVLLRELTPGTLVPYLGHCATIKRVVKRSSPPNSENSGNFGVVAKSQQEAETMYEVEWNPGQTLDVQKYIQSVEESLEQKSGSDGTPRQLQIVPSSSAQVCPVFFHRFVLFVCFLLVHLSGSVAGKCRGC
jgi:phosphate/sulfate permease